MLKACVCEVRDLHVCGISRLRACLCRWEELGAMVAREVIVEGNDWGKSGMDIAVAGEEAAGPLCSVRQIVAEECVGVM
jgi:hypothetical protein